MFKCGNVVALKSGGPHMTVDKWTEEEATKHSSDEIPTMWFDEELHLQRGVFRVDQLSLRY